MNFKELLSLKDSFLLALAKVVMSQKIRQPRKDSEHISESKIL